MDGTFFMCVTQPLCRLRPLVPGSAAAQPAACESLPPRGMVITTVQGLRASQVQRSTPFLCGRHWFCDGPSPAQLQRGRQLQLLVAGTVSLAARFITMNAKGKRQAKVAATAARRRTSLPPT